MKKQKWLKLALGFLVLCGFCVFGLYLFGVYLFVSYEEGNYQMDPLHNEPWASTKDYYINPATILADIKNGKTDIFPIFPEGEPFPDNPSGSFAWFSEDYFAVARAHHLFLTGETADGAWKVFAPGNFEIKQCNDNMQGFDSATIIFYKREDQSFPVTYMEIRPLRKLISSAYLEYERIQHESWIDQILDNPDDSFREALSVQGQINAERALQIAEEAGGAEVRRRFSNNCRIRITYFTDDWVVWYRQGGSVLLKVNVDAQDGSYTIDPPWMWK